MNSIDDILNRIKRGSEEENKKIAEELKSGLSAEQTESLNRILGDSALIEKLMKSKLADEILKKTDGENNGS